MKKTRLFAMVMGVAISGLAQAATYSRVVQVEAGGLECAARAARVSALFQSNASVKKIGTVECVNEYEGTASFGPYRVYSIHVQYDTDHYLDVPTAEYGTDVMGFESGNSSGAFASLDDCLKARPGEMAAYEEQTGVAPLFLACVPDHSDFSENYVLSIAGFGSARKQLQAYEFSRAYTQDGSLSGSQVQWLNQEISRLGGAVRMNDGRRVFYYADGSLPLALNSGGWFAETQQCSSQLADVQAIFNRDALKGLVECRQFETRARMEIVTAQLSFGVSELYEQKYSTFDICMKYKRAVSARQQQYDPGHFLGLVCSPSYSGSGFVHLKFATY